MLPSVILATASYDNVLMVVVHLPCAVIYIYRSFYNKIARVSCTHLSQESLGSSFNGFQMVGVSTP